MTVGEATEAYAAYLNARARAASHYEPEQLAEFDADLAKAAAAMQLAWLEQHPVHRRSPA